MNRRGALTCAALLAILLLLAALAGCSSTAANSAAPVTSQPVFQDTPATDTPNNVKPPVQPPANPPAQPPAIPRAEAVTSDQNTPPTPPVHVYPPGDGKKVYLTFDDGPNNIFTPRILDILKQAGARATFMVVGTNVEKNPGIVRQIVDEGNGLANHTYSHDYKIIYRSPEAFIADLNRCSDAVQAITGEPVKVFRAPGGPENLKPSFLKAIAANGYYSVSWNVVGGDASPRGVTADQVYNNVVSGLNRVEKLHLTPIILLHDGTQLSTLKASPNSTLGRYIQSREAVIKALPKIIELLKSRGYTFAITDQNTPAAW